MPKRKFSSFEEGKAYLEERGELEFCGTIYINNQSDDYFQTYILRLPNGMKYRVYLHHDGLLEAWVRAPF